jgi:beta-lactamase regulating signal transducer with metallopeptidase domain
MRAALTSLLANPYVVFTGWTLLMILWETTLVGLALAMWRLMHYRSAARDHYKAAVVAFVASLLLAVVTPVALTALPVASSRTGDRTVPGTAPSAGHEARRMDAPPVVRGGESVLQGSSNGVSPDAIASAAAVTWAIGVVLLAGRLIGGWILAQSVARRAGRIQLPQMTDALDGLRKELHFEPGILVLQSAAVDAPVVVGWRRPALILPDEAASLTPETLTPLLAHEFAHIVRRDYVANLFQSIVELLLFFSPAVVWMSRRIREAREFCCDDVAVAKCGDAKHYVRALTTLAALGAMNTTRPALGAAGPRLITRVRRLLQEEPMPKFNSARIALLSPVIVVLLFVGMRVSAASAARAPRVSAGGAITFQEKVPYGWQTSPEGAGVELEKFVSTAEAPAQSVTVRNISTAPIVGVQFLAAVEQFPAMRIAPRPPVRLFTSDMLPVSIPPGGTATVSPQVLSAEQLQQIVADSGGARIQFFFGLQRVRFANGFEWTTTPNPAATTGSDAFNIARPVYSRDLIVRDATSPEVAFGACRDERNRATSHGGLVPILNEPGKFVRCQNGRWVESAAR